MIKIRSECHLFNTWLHHVQVIRADVEVEVVHLSLVKLLSLTILQQASTDAAATHSLMLKKYEARWIALSAGTRFRSSHSAGDLFAPE